MSNKDVSVIVYSMTAPREWDPGAKLRPDLIHAFIWDLGRYIRSRPYTIVRIGTFPVRWLNQFGTMSEVHVLCAEVHDDECYSHFVYFMPKSMADSTSDNYSFLAEGDFESHTACPDAYLRKLLQWAKEEGE